MKLNFGKKLALFLHWLLSLIICVLLALMVFCPHVISSLVDLLARLTDPAVVVVLGGVGLLLYLFTAVITIAIIFSRGKNRSDRSMITVDSSDAGKTRIAISAVEQMIRQAVASLDGIADMKCSVSNNNDTVAININVSLLNGAHVPTVTMNMQRAIRNYIEINCGVAVGEICISVNALENPGEIKRGSKKNVKTAAPAAPVPAVEIPAVKEMEAAAEVPEEDVTEESSEPEPEIVEEAIETVEDAADTVEAEAEETEIEIK